MSRKVVAPLRREQILNGLFSAMSKKGFEAVSISDIARESGVARGVLHYYFTNKEEMLLELNRILTDNYHSHLQKYVARYETPLEKLKAFIRFHSTGQEREVNELAGVWVEFWGKAAGGHHVAESVAGLQIKLRAMIDGFLREGIKDGSIRKVNTGPTAVAILGAVEGLLLQWRVNSRLVSMKDTVEEMERMVMCLATDQSPVKPKARHQGRGKGEAQNG
jgi:TetR/AcrR family transcriptional regulator, fatty acid metabolism regulator protein